MFKRKVNAVMLPAEVLTLQRAVLTRIEVLHLHLHQLLQTSRQVARNVTILCQHLHLPRLLVIVIQTLLIRIVILIVCLIPIILVPVSAFIIIMLQHLAVRIHISQNPPRRAPARAPAQTPTPTPTEAQSTTRAAKQSET